MMEIVVSLKVNNFKRSLNSLLSLITTTLNCSLDANLLPSYLSCSRFWQNYFRFYSIPMLNCHHLPSTYVCLRLYLSRPGNRPRPSRDRGRRKDNSSHIGRVQHTFFFEEYAEAIRITHFENISGHQGRVLVCDYSVRGSEAWERR